MVEATVHAIQLGALKRVGVLFTIDAEAFASPASLLKVNFGIHSLWATGLIILKPRTDRWKTPRHDGCSIPFADIPAIVMEVNRAFTKLGPSSSL